MTDIAERVAAGVKWLDQFAPDWMSDVDIKALNFRSCWRCIIGQVYGYYWDAPWFGHMDGQAALEFADSLGMNVADMRRDPGPELDALRDEWRRVIVARRRAQADLVST